MAAPHEASMPKLERRSPRAEAAEMKAMGERFGRIVRQRRESLGLSQEVLASRAKLNRTYLGDVERGVSVPSLVTAAKLAAALEVTLSSLVVGFENGLQP
jgi:XRE family transcriptional regulator, regulator of sulfur utilization